jgi:exopolysaccharide biosynthesis polyprenyl glycosylphosphotransferase
MVIHRIQGLSKIHFAAQVFAIVTAYWLYVLWFIELPDTSWLNHYILYCGLIVLGLLVHEVRFKHDYQIGVPHESFTAYHHLACNKLIYSAVFLTCYLLATRDAYISRFFFFSFFLLVYVILFLTDWWIPKALARRIFKGLHEQRTLMVGSGIRADALTEWLNRKELLGVELVGLLQDEKDPVHHLHGVPVLGKTNDLELIISKEKITHVILLELPSIPSTITQMVQVCEKCGVRLLMVDNLDEYFMHRVTSFEDDGVRFFCIRDEPLQNPLNRLIKRLLDIAIAIPVVVFVLPMITAVVWLCQRFQSPGPLFYTQRRAGIQNEGFDIIKYRTMHVNNPDVSKQATMNDNRVYGAGRLFRKFSIDELPQFWNVLRNDMSVVGPRPHILKHNEQFAKIMSNYHIRTFVKPGITGLAQIKNCRGETKNDHDLVRRIQWDLYYVENWSIDLELSIVLQTFQKVILPPKEAY